MSSQVDAALPGAFSLRAADVLASVTCMNNVDYSSWYGLTEFLELDGK